MKAISFTWRVLQIGAGYVIAIPLFLFIQATNLFWRTVYGLEAEKREDRQRFASGTKQSFTGGQR